MENSVKLHFGCGGNILEGWQNFDSEMDIRKPLPFPDNHADICFACHLLEHVSCSEAYRFLAECHRILKPQGVMRLCCPVVGPHLTREHVVNLLTDHGHQIGLTEDLMRTLLWVAGFELNQIQRTDRKDCDGHFREIGLALDNLETVRLEATK